MYAFFLQTIPGTLKSVYSIESERILKKEKSLKSGLTIKNRFFWYMGLNLITPILIYLKFGLKGAASIVSINIVSILILEIINYIEHYGIERKKLADGTYEKVNHYHSWNSPHRLSNYFFFKV